MEDLCVLILAAGKGTRMVSNRAKVLHKICGIPMLQMIYRAAAGVEPDAVFVVIGQDAGRVQASLEGSSATFILQQEQLGTGHAVMSARERLQSKSGDVLVLFGDTPRIKTATLNKLIAQHKNSNAATTLLTVIAPNPFGYGRIIRNADGGIQRIVEENDATLEQRKIKEINPGFYCFRIPQLLQALEKLTNNNAQREYYMTDLIEIQNHAGLRVNALAHGDYDELRGINTRRELADLSLALRRQKNDALMAAGVTLIDAARAYIDLDVAIAKDVIIHPMVTLEGKTRVGEATVIRSGSRISDSTIEAEVEISDSCIITESEIKSGAMVGPFARVRNHSVIGERCRIGNFVEIKKSTLGAETKAAHLAYLGDAIIGDNVNIGAGTITCNYDGVRKNTTIIEDNAFIGTDCQLVAPVRIGRGAYVAAGSCITEDVPAEALGIARGRQTNKEGWARRRRASLQKP